MRPIKKNLVLPLFFLFFASILALRLFSDHTQNYHYTGDYLAEKILMTTADNFEKFGAIKTRFMPIFETMPDTPQTSESLRPHFYTHFPPLPYWLFDGIYLAFGKSELAARISAVLISLLGLFFACKSVLLIKNMVQPAGDDPEDNTAISLIILTILALNPTFLFFGDTIQQHSLTEALQWASLFWCLQYLFRQTSLWWGILLYWLHVWTSFEWLVPLFFIFSFCIYKRGGNLKNSLKPLSLFFCFGFLLPIFGRLLHNSWALGGLQIALSDLLNRAAVRSLGSTTEIGMHYSVIKHVGKIFFGLFWFAGFSALLFFTAYASPLWKKLKGYQTLRSLLLLWGIGSISWQFLMPQNAMIHAYSQMHIANFIFLMASISVALFWKEQKGSIIALFILFCVGAGALIQAEIVGPFLNESTQKMAIMLCPQDRLSLLEKAKPIKNPMADSIRLDLAVATGNTDCDNQSGLIKKILSLYLYGIKGRF